MTVTVALRLSLRTSPEREAGRKSRWKPKAKPVDDGRARYELVGTGLGTDDSPIFLDRELPRGGAAEYVAARKQGVRSFAMWTDPHRRHLWARVVTSSAAEGQPAHYDVYGPAGECVGSITRERSFSCGHVRTRWTVQPAGGPVAVGYKGRWFWWCMWWLIFPFQSVLAVASLLGGGGDLFRTPRRVRYFAGRTCVLDYGSGFEARHLTAETEGWDPRILAALTALHSSHDGILGDSWDTGGYEPPAAGTGAAGSPASSTAGA